MNRSSRVRRFLRKPKVRFYFGVFYVAILLTVAIQVVEAAVVAKQQAASVLNGYSYTPDGKLLQPNIPPVTDFVFEHSVGPDVPTLQSMTAGATSDDEALQMVADYYEAHKDDLRVLWREDNPTRLAGIYTMYVVHISTDYGETTYPDSFLDYLKQPRAHCGTYSLAQSEIAEKMGLTWRLLSLTSGWHGWVEIQVDGNWELFDATTNTWIDHSAYDLVKAVPREYRHFYTPMLDSSRPDARLHLDEGYNMQNLREMLPGLGIYYNPPGEIVASQEIDKNLQAYKSGT